MDTAKQCECCGGTFLVSSKDSAFYNKVSPQIGGIELSVPPPKCCFDCRQQRKLAFRNERTFYSRTCDLSGKQIMSVYAPNTELCVVDHEVWYSDAWDGRTFGRSFDFSRPFFEQFFELHREVPLMSLDVKNDNENCNYTNLITQSKNCYFAIASTLSENCLYSTYLQRNRSVVDCFFIFDSEECYQCVDCYHSHRLHFAQYCQNCHDSALLYNCRNCSDCFGCVFLDRKRYHIFNRPYQKDEYHRVVAGFRSSPEKWREAEALFLELKRSKPLKYYAGVSNEQVSGDHISYSKQTAYSFDCTYLEDCKFCTWMHKSKDCYDCYGWGLGGELGYESHLIGNTFYRVLFSESCWEGISELTYCRYCVQRCRNLFGCIGLKNSEYCILNKQYSKEEYERLVPKIVAHMRETNEWGEFFPMRYSPFSYNESVAQEYYPLDRQTAVAAGLLWKEDLPHSFGKETITQEALPYAISEVDDSIVKHILCCSECQRNYRITTLELQFYRRHAIPLPKHCFACRHQQRQSLRNPRVLYRRSCSSCNIDLETSYSPITPQPVLCEPCYQKTFIA